MADQMRIRGAEGTWVVRAGGAVLGESDRALELSDGDGAPVIYFPREDIAMAFLDPTDHRPDASEIGDARYFSIVTKSTVLQNAAWSYEKPKSGMEALGGYIAFHPGDLLAVEAL
jgi:uncharacterized protein (DUF427 family)